MYTRIIRDACELMSAAKVFRCTECTPCILNEAQVAESCLIIGETLPCQHK